jgi:hypothetical protein
LVVLIRQFGMTGLPVFLRWSRRVDFRFAANVLPIARPSWRIVYVAVLYCF